jgi:hypothetical protein
MMDEHPAMCICCEIDSPHKNWLSRLYHTWTIVFRNGLLDIMASSLSSQQRRPSRASRVYPQSKTGNTGSSGSPSTGSVLSGSQAGSNSGSGTTQRSLNIAQQHGGNIVTRPPTPPPPPLHSFVVFGVKNAMHDYYAIENINMSNISRDTVFFKELKAQYNINRSLLLRIFSPFRFRHCNFVEVSMLRVL